MYSLAPISFIDELGFISGIGILNGLSLPTILSDCLCSRQQNKRRFAFVIDIILDENTQIVSINYTNALIKVFKNFQIILRHQNIQLKIIAFKIKIKLI